MADGREAQRAVRFQGEADAPIADPQAKLEILSPFDIAAAGFGEPMEGSELACVDGNSGIR
jgi:hypothetical protein